MEKHWRQAAGELRKLRWHDKTGEVIQILALAFSPDGRVLASGSGSSWRLWDVAAGHEIRMLIDHASIKAVAFSPDGRILASASDALKLWDVATGREIATLGGHLFEIVAFSPNGQVVAFGSDDGTVGLCDAATGRELRTISEHADVVKSAAFSPDGILLGVTARRSSSGTWRPDANCKRSVDISIGSVRLLSRRTENG